MNRKTGFLFHPIFLEHQTGPGHPERPDRVLAALEHLKTKSFFAELNAVPAKKAALEWVRLVHGSEYLDRAERSCREGASVLDTADVAISEKSFEAALWACGGALELTEAVQSGKIQNGFALLRPPGHHAEQGFAMGFCLINNVAVAARYLQKKYGLKKILILDWDVHHGNGTQHTFEDDPGVLYISTHQFPFYPGTGAYWETGMGRGEGFTLNIPMKAGSGDVEYKKAFEEKIIPQVEDYAPEFIFISAGFDAHASDPLADIRLSTEFYGWATEALMRLAQKHAGGKIVSLLEGGYDLKALGECVALHLEKLNGRDGKAGLLKS